MKYHIAVEAGSFSTNADLESALRQVFENGVAGSFQVVPTLESRLVVFERNVEDDIPELLGIMVKTGRPAQYAAMVLLSMQLLNAWPSSVDGTALIANLSGGNGLYFDFGNNALAGIAEFSEISQKLANAGYIVAPRDEGVAKGHVGKYMITDVATGGQTYVGVGDSQVSLVKNAYLFLLSDKASIELDALDDPAYRRQMQGLRDITAAIDGHTTSPVVFSTDANSVLNKAPVLLEYVLVKTTRRLTFDIISQVPQVTYAGEDDGDYFTFFASNGYEVISRSRMDIQTERIWLLGARKDDEPRSGSMVFSSNEKRDLAYNRFTVALNEWAARNGGVVKQVPCE